LGLWNEAEDARRHAAKKAGLKKARKEQLRDGFTDAERARRAKKYRRRLLQG
jgi:hypothetical protein